MKILILSARDIKGGAAIAAFRLNRELQKLGLNTNMLVQSKSSDDHSVIGPISKLDKLLALLRPTLDKVPSIFYDDREIVEWSNAWFPNNINKIIKEFGPDIIHLQWINSGFLSIKNISKISQPIIWRLSDAWPFTGGCHLPYDCINYETGCGHCPILKSNKKRDLSYKNLKKKKKHWRHNRITIVSPSNWLAEKCKRSQLFNERTIKIIPTGVDTDVFKPYDKDILKDWLNIPKNKKIIFFGASNVVNDPNKGYSILEEIMNKLDYKNEEISWIIFGGSDHRKNNNKNFDIQYVGSISDNSTLAMYYVISDVFLCLSRTENFPNTVLESMSCGTPVVAFNVGGLPEIIDHKKNGYLAQPYLIDDIIKGIKFVIKDEDKRKSLSIESRNKVVDCFNIKKMAQAYSDLYKKILTL